MAENLANDVQVLLNGAITNVATAITVAANSGFPAVNFRVRCENELMLVTNVGAGTNWTVTRGIESTTAAAHPDAAPVVHVLSAGGLKQWVEDGGGGVTTLMPPGAIIDYGGASIPSGYLLCDGSAVSRTTYSALFTALSTTWGAGDGSTTFNVPDFRGRGRVGDGTGTVAETVTAANVTVATDLFIVVSNNTKWITGQPVILTTTGGLPAPLAVSTTYYVVRASATTIKFATSLANAQNGTVIDITTQGTGNHTVTGTLTARTLGEGGGEEAHAMSIAELLGHTHNVTGNTGANVLQGGTTTGYTTTPTSGTGGNAAMNIMHPFGVTKTIIKT